MPILPANYYNYSQNPKVSATSGGVAALQQYFNKLAVQQNMAYFSGTTTNAERALWDSLWKDTVPNMSFSQVVDVWQGMTLLNAGAGYSAKDTMTTTAFVNSYAGVNTGTVTKQIAQVLAPNIAIINGELVRVNWGKFDAKVDIPDDEVEIPLTGDWGPRVASTGPISGQNEYDRIAAAAYARYWGGKDNDINRYNPNYAAMDTLGFWAEYAYLYHVNGGMADCANFVSQALIAGGFRMNDDWYYYKIENNFTVSLAALLGLYYQTPNGDYTSNTVDYLFSDA